jgi:hypothetical protein
MAFRNQALAFAMIAAPRAESLRGPNSGRDKPGVNPEISARMGLKLRPLQALADYPAQIVTAFY